MTSTVTQHRREPVAGGRSVELKVRLTTEEYLALQARAQAERVSVQKLLVDMALAPIGPSLRAALHELLGYKLQLTSLTHAMVEMAQDAEEGGYDVDVHDLAAHQISDLCAEIMRAVQLTQAAMSRQR